MNDMNNNDREHKYGGAKPGSLNKDHIMPLWYYKTKNTIYYILGIIEVLLAFRFVFKLLGANPDNSFVAFLYTTAGIFTAPFTGIFNSFVSPGLAAKSVFEPAVIIAMIVYAVLAWSLLGLVRLIASKEG